MRKRKKAAPINATMLKSSVDIEFKKTYTFPLTPEQAKVLAVFTPEQFEQLQKRLRKKAVESLQETLREYYFGEIVKQKDDV